MKCVSGDEAFKELTGSVPVKDGQTHESSVETSLVQEFIQLQWSSQQQHSKARHEGSKSSNRNVEGENDVPDC